MTEKFLPLFVKGTIVKGFGRGAKELGFPTANYPEEVTEALPADLGCGIYYGWSKVDDGAVLPMVASLGYNPFYQNTTKCMETHVIHNFDCDLYGSLLKNCLLGWIRDEKNFESLEGLVDEIKNDIKIAMKELERPEMMAFKDHEYFKDK